jgi:NRPS condensation-like uncharacterized protein
MEKTEQKIWYKLDNAAKLYPAISSHRWMSIYRVSIKLYEPVDKDMLQRALNITMGRVSLFSCRLKAGLFWYYFEKNPSRALVEEDAVNPCMRIEDGKRSGHLFRVRVYDKRISLEVFHSISDGYGGIIFLKTLVAEYLKQKGYTIPAQHGVLDCDDAPDDAETEDAFLRYYNKKAVRPWKEERAYHIHGTKEKGHTLNVISGLVPVQDIKAVAKRYQISVTEFLVSVYMFALYNVQKKDNPHRIRPIKVSVPVNLRVFFPSETLRNFSSYVNPLINANWGNYTFEEVAQLVHHHLRSEMTNKHLAARMSKNVKAEKNILVRMMPLFFKNFVISLIFHMAGESRMTSAMSNIGAMDMPEEMALHVDRFDAMLGAPRHYRINCAVCAFKGIMNICFSSTIKETQVEREFFTFLVKMGIHVKLETNREI